jgi:hypothetical protein
VAAAATRKARDVVNSILPALPANSTSAPPSGAPTTFTGTGGAAGTGATAAAAGAAGGAGAEVGAVGTVDRRKSQRVLTAAAIAAAADKAPLSVREAAEIGTSAQRDRSVLQLLLPVCAYVAHGIVSWACALVSLHDHVCMCVCAYVCVCVCVRLT